MGMEFKSFRIEYWIDEEGSTRQVQNKEEATRIRVQGLGNSSKYHFHQLDFPNDGKHEVTIAIIISMMSDAYRQGLAAKASEIRAALGF